MQSVLLLVHAEAAIFLSDVNRDFAPVAVDNDKSRYLQYI